MPVIFKTLILTINLKLEKGREEEKEGEDPKEKYSHLSQLKTNTGKCFAQANSDEDHIGFSS